MSNFSGVTFPFQKVTPSDDAIVRRAVITDGILSGCKLTYAGTGLTMEAGNLLICCRQIRHGVTETWDFGGATSGYARLVLTIDATKTSTLDAFDMVDASVEYATAEDGFYSLIQEDINTSGTKYQATVCIVSLNDGGINEIVQNLPAASAKGAGGLNFKVVGGTTRPADPEENTIWVNTDIPITDVIISNAKPVEWEYGMVWIKTGLYSYGHLNVSAEGAIDLYPVECHQFVYETNNTTQIKTAETFCSGKWKDWKSYLFKDGDMCAELTGGWIVTNPSNAAITDTSIKITHYYGTTSDVRYYLVYTAFDINFTNIRKLILNSGWLKTLDPTGKMRAVLAVGPSRPDYDNLWYNKLVSMKTASSVSDASNVWDVSSVSGKNFVYIYLEGRETSGAFTRVDVDITQIEIER